MSRLPATVDATLRLPLICAPMFLVSGPELVIAACRAGIVGALPAHNARTPEEFGEWMDRIAADLAADANAGPLAVNVATSPKTGGRRWEADMAIVERHRPPIVITALGDPSEIVRIVHGYGGIVLHDAIQLAHARKAVEAGVDGLNLICAGGGGHAGVLNPFVFVPQVRAFFDGIVCLAGAMADGRGIRAAQLLGADLVYMGTRFIATQESRASAEYKQMLVDHGSLDILYTPAVSGVPASWLKGSIERVGLDPANLPQPEGPMRPNLPQGLRAWRDIWSAGQAVGRIEDVPTVATLVDRISADYDAACSASDAPIYPIHRASP